MQNELFPGTPPAIVRNMTGPELLNRLTIEHPDMAAAIIAAVRDEARAEIETLESEAWDRGEKWVRDHVRPFLAPLRVLIDASEDDGVTRKARNAFDRIAAEIGEDA